MSHVVFTSGPSELELVGLKLTWENNEPLWHQISNQFPSLKIIRGWDEQEVIRLVGAIHGENSDNLSRCGAEFQRIWDRVEKRWFGLLDKIFDSPKFGEDQLFRAFVGISPISPRDIDQGSFTIPFLSGENDVRRVCAHETSHFFFYRTVGKMLSGSIWSQVQFSEKIWIISELMVPLLFGDPESISAIGEMPCVSYLCTDDLIDHFRSIYNRRREGKVSFSEMLEEMLGYEIHVEDLDQAFLTTRRKEIRDV